MYLKTLWTLLQHKWYVFRAGLVLKVPLWQLIIHDLSKFSLYEFGKYARNFQGDYTGSPNDRELVSLEFQKAWVHHENRNAHHWGHWIPRAGTMAGIPVPMPERYVREMIADCIGASLIYTGHWDIAVWMNENARKWRIHDETLTHISTIMFELGYILTDNCDWSWMSTEKTRHIFQ